MHNNNLGASSTGAILVIVLIIAAGVAFTLMRDDTNPPSTNNTTSPNNNTNQMMGPVEVVLSEQNASKQTGRVTLTEVDGKSKVVIEITPGPKGVAQPAHIHSGTCAELGSVKYPLTDVVDGKSETTLTPSLHFLHGLGQLSINVHKSTTEAGVYVACGGLTEAFNAAMHTGN
jgi:hypothetical protein